MDLRWKRRLAVIAAACAGSATAHAQTAAAPAPAPAAAAPADDMAMPDDLGAPLAGTQATAPAAAASTQALSIDEPIAQVAANPQGKAVLERDLPGLCGRPEFPMFKTLSLRRLAAMSNGRITSTDLAAVQSDLTRIGPVQVAASPSRGAFYPLLHTASYSVRYGGREIKHISHSIYHRVALVIASM